MKKLYLTWEDIQNDIDILAKKIERKKFQFITGLPRGGLIPAVLLSHKLDITYKSLSLSKAIEEGKYLLIDDIADSGETLIDKKYEGYIKATLHYKKHSLIKPDYYAREIPNDVWLIYPWENEKSETIQDYKIKQND
jgi:hypoxanthine phosphoribosyltransferase